MVTLEWSAHYAQCSLAEMSVPLRAVVLALLVAAWSGVSAGSRAADRLSVLPGLEQHWALTKLDLKFCGTGSESQVSRGPLGCGYPVVGDNPWLVALGFAVDGHSRYLCSGALISDQYVVTSARCARGTRSLPLRSVRLGEYDFRSRRDCLWYDQNTCLEAEEVPVADVAVHPRFVRRAGDASPFDVALVRLARPVTLRHGLRPICLPMFSRRSPSHRQFALTLGLNAGRQPVMKEDDGGCCSCDRDRSITHHVMDQQRLSVFNTSSAADAGCRYRLLSAQPGQPARCLGDGEQCLADLGAPLVAADRFGSTYYLEGVASVRPLQSACQAKSAPVLYAPVRPHLRWLLDAIRELEQQAHVQTLVHKLADRFGLGSRSHVFLGKSYRPRRPSSTRIIFPIPNYGSGRSRYGGTRIRYPPRSKSGIRS